MRRIVAVGLVALAVAGSSTLAGAAAPVTGSGFRATEKITRDHLVAGKNDVVDTRTVTVTASATKNLRDRQAIDVTWKGAHPTGGLVTDHNSAAAAGQEYPVVLMQCRGTDSRSLPVNKQVSPQTCWTQTPGERFQYSPSGTIYPSYRMDRYASTENRALTVGQPNPLPAGCPDVTAAHWIPFVAADRTVYPGGNLGCAGLAPEAANSADSLQPGNTTYGVADAKGNGSANFVVDGSESNASIGCSATVPCTLEVIPIMGISCDAAGTAGGADHGMPAADRPTDPQLIDSIFADCSKTGHFAPGQYNGGGEVPDLAVSGSLWWDASNWRNRVAIPLTFAPSASVCDVVSSAQTEYLYGAETLLQATQQWSPKFCLDPKSFAIRHVQTSEPEAKNLLNIGNISAAIQGSPPSTPFTNPIVQAPAAVTGFAITYSVDGANEQPVGTINLDARLLAKLLSESYRSCATCLDFTSAAAVQSGFAKLAANPIDMSDDPEFTALNPGISSTLNREAGATLSVMSSDSDVMTALTSYLNADPEARAWLNGKPDPWGMVVNPAYKKIVLPVSNWPLLDTHIAQFPPGSNQCLSNSPVPWLPLVAAPLSSPAAIALNMQFDIANSQIFCKNNGAQNQKLTGLGREAPGGRFLFGLVSLADAERYEIHTASLQSHNTGTEPAAFTDTTGRTFVRPDNAGLRAAADLLHPDKKVQSWVLPYSTMRTSLAGQTAYPGTMLISLDVPTSGLAAADAANYATLLRFIAGAGQTPGLATGDLPPGYLPLTAGNGLSAQLSYTTRAADAVAAQQGAVWPLTVVPPPSSSAPPSSSPASSPPASSVPASSAPASSPAPSRSAASSPGISPTSTRPSQPSSTYVSAPFTPAPIGYTPPVTHPSSTGSPSSVASSSASSSAPTSPGTTGAPTQSPVAAPMVPTSSIRSGALGLALPVLALLALVALGSVGWFSGVGRRG